MPKPMEHSTADCGGRFVRIYQRPNRTGAVVPTGYLCNRCHTYRPDELPVTSKNELRPAVEAIATEISLLLWDRQVERRFEGIVHGNAELLTAAQQNNPFLVGVRRWWATSAALVVRRHVDGDGLNTLRGVVEALVGLETPFDPGSAEVFRADLARLEAISSRFGPHLNALLHGVPSGNPVTFNDLYDAIDALKEIAQRAYARITNISRRLDPVAQFDWNDIFTRPWIADDVQAAYELGTEGVPYDALFLSNDEGSALAHVALQVRSNSDGSAEIIAVNDGKAAALDACVFLPYAATVIDIDELAVGASVSATLSPELAHQVTGQAVIEFADIYDTTYREYADVVVPSGRVRKLSRVAFRVGGRIVSRNPFAIAR